jgi:hypothetical protein
VEAISEQLLLEQKQQLLVVDLFCSWRKDSELPRPSYCYRRCYRQSLCYHYHFRCSCRLDSSSWMDFVPLPPEHVVPVLSAAVVHKRDRIDRSWDRLPAPFSAPLVIHSYTLSLN